MKSKINYRLFFRYSILSFAMAFVLELMLITDWSGLMTSYKTENRTREYKISDINILHNCSLIDGKIVTENADPQLILENINDHIGMMEIQIRDLSVSNIPVQIYWSTDEHGFSEEYSITSMVTEDKESFFIPVNQDVSSIRVDLGGQSDISYHLIRIVSNPHTWKYISGTIRNVSVIRIIFYFFGLLSLLFALEDFEAFKMFFFQYRWGVGIFFVALCTICKVHGSSIGEISKVMTGVDTSRLWGTSRGIRSDEYVAFTEMALSQVRSGFKWFSDVWGYSPSDMFVVYGQPILNLVTIYRPFSIGYIFGGGEAGLAFYWSARLVCCLLISFEFGRILTKDNRILSLAYAVLIAFSPIVQWWYSINELVEMLIFGQLALVILHYYIRTNNIKLKCLMMCGLVMCAGGYVLTLYPAWMIPFAYVFLACTIAMITEDRKIIKIKKSDIFIWICGIAVLAISAYYVMKNSFNTISAVMNTAYPGKRLYEGGPIDNFIELFRGWTSFLWSFVSIGNPCEEVCFVSFMPIGFILSLITIFREKIKDIWLVVLNIMNVFLILYLTCEVPSILGVVTLMNKSTIRLVNAIGLINLIILFRSLIFLRNGTGFAKIFLPFSFIIGGFSFYGCQNIAEFTPGLKTIVFIFTLLSVWIIINTEKRQFQQCFLLLSTTVGIVGGLMVNPIESGLSTVYHIPIMQTVEKMNNDDEGLWAVTDTWLLANIPTIVGAHTLNALATYPDRQLWHSLGFETDEEIWNRYAHTEVHIAEKSYLELGQSDMIKLYVTVGKLKDVGVKYILSCSDLSEYNGLTELYAYNQFKIWRVGD